MKIKQAVLFFLLGCLIGPFLLYFVREINDRDITKEHIASAEILFGLEFNEAQRDSMLDGVIANRDGYFAVRELNISNDVWPSILFNPIPHGKQISVDDSPSNWGLPEAVQRPETDSEIAFMTVAELGVLLRTGQLTSVELTQIYLNRIEQYDPILEGVITLTADLALVQAARADEELAAGIDRGPLHGIPYGSKDLLALEGFPTTWGAMPYKDQEIELTATVIQRLEEAGAVHLAKLSLGALAWGDVWFDGFTKSPWNTDIGASGSSAGSASLTAAGLMAFAIGSETLGSIVSPSTRNGTTGLRPTYGRVSRHGAMALSWSMDKIGPITRSVQDAALVFDAIYGPDNLDPTLYDFPFSFNADLDISTLRIGYIASSFESNYAFRSFDEQALDVLRELGAELIPIELPELPMNGFSSILSVEAATAFDELTLSGKDNLMVRQIKNAWPNVFRTSRFVPAVEYIQANRARTLLIQQMDEVLKDVDVYISPSFAGSNLLITNLTGNPSVVVPNGFMNNGMPVSITFNGHLFDEGTVLSLSHAYQKATDFHRSYPPEFQ